MGPMGGRQSATDLALLEHTLREQWLALRRWIGALERAAWSRPSVLEGWTVGDVVAHLGRTMDVLATAQPTPAGTVPRTLAEYLGGLATHAQEITERTHAAAAEIAGDPLRAIDGSAAQAFAQLTDLHGLAPDPVVRARRGPILLSELVISRLIELVVHGDDLVRSVQHGGRDPLAEDAVRVVSEALLEVVVDRGGWRVEVTDHRAWIRLACGRVPFSGAAVAAALQPVHTSDSLPDLGAALPVL